MRQKNLNGMTIVRILIDYGDTGFLYCMTIATKDVDSLLNCMKGYSHDVRYLDVKKKAGKNDKGNRVLPDGSIIIGATAFGDKVSANTAFNKSENRMNPISQGGDCMKDAIEQFLDDYNAGRIDVNDLQRRINYMDWSQNKSNVMPMDYVESGEEPCDVLVNQEKKVELMKTLCDLKANLSDDDWQMFLMTARGFTQEEIANKLHYTRSSVIRHMQRIAKIKPELRTLLKKDTPMYFADTPKDKLRYPMDIARKVTDPDGKVRCHLPEYLHTQDCDSICTYCQNCTRKQ